MDNGTEEQAEQFVKQHINEFPPEVRDETTLAFFEEGIRELAEERAGGADLQEDILNDVHDITSSKRILEDKLKVLDLEEKLK